MQRQVVISYQVIEYRFGPAFTESAVVHIAAARLVRYSIKLNVSKR